MVRAGRETGRNIGLVRRSHPVIYRSNMWRPDAIRVLFESLSLLLFKRVALAAPGDSKQPHLQADTPFWLASRLQAFCLKYVPNIHTIVLTVVELKPQADSV